MTQKNRQEQLFTGDVCFTGDVTFKGNVIGLPGGGSATVQNLRSLVSGSGAIAAGLAVGFWKNLDELAAHQKIERVFEPQIGADEAEDRTHRRVAVGEQVRLVDDQDPVGRKLGEEGLELVCVPARGGEYVVGVVGVLEAVLGLDGPTDEPTRPKPGPGGAS